jgi:hypothetical protein
VTGGRLNVAAAVAALVARTDRVVAEDQADGGTAPTPTPPPASSEPPPASSEPAPDPAPAPTASPQPTTTPLQPADAPPMPLPAPRDAVAPMLRLTPSPGRSLQTLLSRRELRVAVRCSERCALRLELRRGASRISRATGSRSRAGTTTVSPRLSAVQRRRLARLRSVRLTLRVVASDPAGNRRTVSRRLVLRR